MTAEKQYGDSTPEINPIAPLSQVLSIEPSPGVFWGRQPESPDRWWRFHGYVDFDSPFQEFPMASINIEMWRLLRRTPKGAWITPPFSNKWNAERVKKFILNDSRKKHAYPTKKEAWESFCIRLQHRRGYWDREGQRLEALDAVVKAESGEVTS